MTFVHIENAKKIAAQLGLSSLEVVSQSQDTVCIRGTAAYRTVHRQLQDQLRFKPHNDSNECADVAQHVWFRRGLGSVTIQGSLYNGNSAGAEMSISFAKAD